MGKLTDGNTAVKGDDNSIGAYTGTNGHSVTIDLEKVSAIKYVKTDLFGLAWGIINPAEVKLTLSVSHDGEKFTDVGEFAMSEEYSASGEWKKRIFELKTETAGRYVRISYSAANFVWASEINVYGEIDEDAPAPDSSDESSLSDVSEESSVSEDAQNGNINIKLNWIYWVCAAVALVAVAGIAVFIAIKKK